MIHTIEKRCPNAWTVLSPTGRVVNAYTRKRDAAALAKHLDGGARARRDTAAVALQIALRDAPAVPEHGPHGKPDAMLDTPAVWCAKRKAYLAALDAWKAEQGAALRARNLALKQAIARLGGVATYTKKGYTRVRLLGISIQLDEDLETTLRAWIVKAFNDG